MSKDIREGEIAITLPDKFDAGVYFTGRIRTPWTRRSECPKNARGSDAVCTIELEERYAAALDGVETCTHLIVLYFMHEARRDLVVQVSRHSGRRGTFALRSPVRPVPIARPVRPGSDRMFARGRCTNRTSSFPGNAVARSLIGAGCWLAAAGGVLGGASARFAGGGETSAAAGAADCCGCGGCCCGGV